MDFWSKLGIALALGGVGVSMALGFAVYIWREMPRWLAFVGFGIGISLCLAGLACFILIPEIEQPEVTISLVEEKDPSLQVHNASNVAATNTKWSFVAFDIDNLEQNKQPLPIPATAFDFLIGDATSMPISLFSRPTVSPLVKEGHKIVGSASVHCPACKRGHTIVFYLTFGAGGWYSDRTEFKDGTLVAPSNVNSIAQAADEILREIPETARTPIRDLKFSPAFNSH